MIRIRFHHRFCGFQDFESLTLHSEVLTKLRNWLSIGFPFSIFASNIEKSSFLLILLLNLLHISNLKAIEAGNSDVLRVYRGKNITLIKRDGR